eukprot:c15528_g1_i1.p1 GENE.c15528_g1_i1~~c15528_g1_i1.p1  ORF type:complete len:397 (+),score=139.64 c15528_g1_i1:48-1238(+)
MEAKEEHPLTLKVMRLCNPSFHPSKSVATFLDETALEVAQSHIPVNSSLILPMAIGKVYLGETFSCFANISNHTPSEVMLSNVKVEIHSTQTVSKLYDLPEKMSLGIGESHNFIVKHQLFDVGNHVLFVNITYTVPPLTVEKSFRRSFKFFVENPLQTYFQMVVVDRKVFVESQIHNTTQGPFILESVNFKPTNYYNISVTSIEVPPVDPSTLQPNQLLFDDSIINANDRVNRIHILDLPQSVMNGSELGALSVKWKNSDGLSGTIDYPKLFFKDPNIEEVIVVPVSPPSQVIQAQPFEIELSVQNRGKSRAIVRVHYAFDQMINIFPVDISGISLPGIPPQSSYNIKVTMVAVKTGFQKIKGIRLVNHFNNVTYHADDLTTVFVLPFSEKNLQQQ